MTFDTLDAVRDFVDVLALPCFILSCDLDGEIRFRHFNPALVATHGVAADIVRGKTPHECLPPRVAETMLNNYTICQRTARPYEYEELLDLGGQEMWWHTTLSPVLAPEGGRVIGMIGVALDITTRKAREFRRTEDESALRRLNDELALFTSMTAHDVRGPLTKIAALSELTLDGFDDMGDNKLEMILSMQQVAGGALKHIDGILGYASALRLGEAEVAAIDLGHMCRDIAAVVDPEADLAITSPDLHVEGESVVLQMILRNLTENAVRYAAGRVQTAVSEEGDGRLRFSVSDDGPGFPGGAAAFAEKLRLRRVTGDNHGFGLAAVAHLVESRGGTTWMDAPVFGRGTTICFDLPGRIVTQDHSVDPLHTHALQAPEAENAAPLVRTG